MPNIKTIIETKCYKKQAGSFLRVVSFCKAMALLHSELNIISKAKTKMHPPQAMFNFVFQKHKYAVHTKQWMAHWYKVVEGTVYV